MKLTKRWLSLGCLLATTAMLVACSSSDTTSKSQVKSKVYRSIYQSDLSDPIMAISRLSEHQHEWKGTRYRLGGNSKAGIDCSGFMQVTFKDLLG